MATTCRRREGFPATARKFFKIIWDPQADSLRIPALFRQRYGHCLPESVFLKVPSGSLLKVELIQSNGEIWLQKGWQEFKERYSIGFGHVLVFQYNGKSQFDVLIFDTTAVEIEYPFDANHNAGEGRKRAFDRMPEIVGNETESDDSIVFLGETVMNKNRLGRWKTQRDSYRTESDVCVEILNEPPPRQQNRSKRWRRDDTIEIPDDLPMDTSFGGMFNLSSCIKNGSGSKFSYPDYHSGSVPNGRVKLNESNSDLELRSAKPKLKEQHGDCPGSRCPDRVKSQGAVAKESCIAYQKALAFKFDHNSQDPYFISLLQYSYVSDRFLLHVPLTFAKGNIPHIGTSSLTLRTANGKSWSVRCTVKTNYAKISNGWKDFVLDNGLKVGDACIFEAAKSNLWNVFIFCS